MIPRFLALAVKNYPITIYGDGQQTRTFCYIDDNIEATTSCLFNNLFVNDTINVGNDAEMTVLDLARTVISVTGSQSEIIHLPALKEGDMTRRLPDIGKMKKVLQRPLTTLEEGLRKMLQHQLQY